MIAAGVSVSRPPAMKITDGRDSLHVLRRSNFVDIDAR